MIHTMGRWLFVLGLLVLGWQIYQFLKFGSWTNVQIVDTLVWMGIKPISNWAAEPGDWRGIHAVLGWIPTSFALIVVGFFLLVHPGKQ